MKTIIPELPEPFIVSEEIQIKLEAWIEYFKNLSPRIKIKRPSDKDFSLQKLEDMAKKLTNSFYKNNFQEIKLDDWPDLEQVAFWVCYDSSLPGHPESFLIRDAYVFCYGDVAFGLQYFTSSEQERVDKLYHFELSFTEDALEWNYVAKLIRERLLEIQKQIKSAKPPPPEEKLFKES